MPHEPVTTRRGRRRWGIASAGVTLAALIAGYAVWAPGQEEPAPPPLTVSTAEVTTGSVASETKVAGTVQYASTVPITSGLAGVVTELPAPGTTLSVGAVVYRVDTRPVIMLSGTVPAWRDFSSDMSDGEDVRQLEQNLRTLGVFSGEPDNRFTWDTTVAIRAWQKSLGVERTGTLERSMILISDQDLRVDAVDSRVGAQVDAGSSLYRATSRQLVVEVNVKSSDRQVAVVGGTVTVSLPTGVTADGLVESVAAPVNKPDADGSGSSIVVPVRITVADQPAVADLALSGVTVSFAGAVTDDVLTVPVDALVPISDTQFAVELPRKNPEAERTLIPVTVGAFASGLVEISGAKIVAGLSVVVPAR
ncbi:peptidoglycan-binding protein [Cryobacterium arcticum]|uniref:Peptidoglycan-binding protein n=1 Tax=Cryobacterium arcticum TaxID=670052 RepID=A0A1B1BPK4_9MICO|nr:peptidoglycan-binding protein [Cryobacterium arcticum]